MIAQQPPQGPPMINCPFAPQPPQFEQRQVAPQNFDSNLGSPIHDFLAAQQHPMQNPFDMLRPLEHLPVNPMEALHHFNFGEHSRHNMGGVEDVGAQNIFGLGHHHHHHHFLEPELGMEQQVVQPMDTQELDQGARTWGKKYKGYNGYDDNDYSKGYNEYDNKDYGGYQKGYSKG